MLRLLECNLLRLVVFLENELTIDNLGKKKNANHDWKALLL